LSARGSVGQSQEEDAFNWQRVADLLDSDDIASFDASWSLDHSYVFVPAYDARTMEARSQRKLMQHPKVIDCDLQRIFGDIWPTRLPQTSKPLSLMNQVRAENQMGQDRPEKRLRLRVLLEMTHLWLRRSGIRDASDTAAAQAVALDAFDALGGAFGPPDLQSAQ
jgi:hypothetical protein